MWYNDCTIIYRKDDCKMNSTFQMRPRLKKTGLIIGILSLFLWVIPLFGLWLSIFGIQVSKEAYQDYELLARIFCWFGITMSLLNSIGLSIYVIVVQLLQQPII